jgi:anti-sigma B factor antagonist
MKITKNLNGDQLDVVLEGRLDTTTAPELENELKASIDNVKNLVFDFAKLEYISSAGLRTLLFAKKALHNKGTVKVVNANEIVKEVFEVTGFCDLIDIE